MSIKEHIHAMLSAESKTVIAFVNEHSNMSFRIFSCFNLKLLLQMFQIYGSSCDALVLCCGDRQGWKSIVKK